MARKHHERTKARASALALLYSSDIAEEDVASIVEAGHYPDDELDLPPYAEDLARGVADHLATIDDYLARTSENWSLDRMPVVDRAILRLAAYEMIFVDDVPVSVTINEAVELAKAYGGEDDSSRFVNGVLGRIARMMESGEIPPAEEEASSDSEEALDAAEEALFTAEETQAPAAEETQAE